MKKFINRATPVSIILNIILTINVVVVLYPVLFTISSSLTESSSLAAKSVIPFTDEIDVSTTACSSCYGTGLRPNTEKQVLNFTEFKAYFNNDAEKYQAVLNAFAENDFDPYRGYVISEEGEQKKIIRGTNAFVKKDVKAMQDALKNKNKLDKSVVENKVRAGEKSKFEIITFTDEMCASCNGAGRQVCEMCNGNGSKLIEVAKSMNGATWKEKHLVDCDACDGVGYTTRLVPSFRLDKPSTYQFRRLLTPSDQEVKGAISVTKVMGTNYKHWYFNTLKVACMNTILTVFLCTLSGYIFSRFAFTGRKQIMASMIILQMFPSFIGMVATYVILWKFGALDTLWGLVLVYSAGSIPFNSMLMKGYFDTMPKDIAEAAYIDGASPLVAFIRVILPAAKPQIVFLGLTSFTGPWMDYIFPRMVLRSDDKKTLAVGLYEMISGRSNDNFTMFAAGAILVAVPFAILFMAGQKTLLMSLAGTSGKE